jgi:MFS family permease
MRGFAARHYPILVLTAAVSMILINGSAIFTIAVALKPIATDFGWPREVPSLAYSLAYIGGGIGGILMGHVLDRWGMGIPATLSAAMIGTGAILVHGIDSAWQLYGVYFFMVGMFGQGALTPPLMAYVIRWYEHRRGMAIGIVSSGQSLAGMVWPPLSGYLVGTYGWRSAYLWAGLLILVVNLPLSLVLHRRAPDGTSRPHDAEPAAVGRAARSARQDSVLTGMSPTALQIALCCAIVFCCTAMSLPLAHMVAYVSDLGHPASRGAEVLSVMLFSSFVSRAILLGWLTDRIGGLRALFCFSLVQATMLAAFGLNQGLVAFYVIAALYGLGYGALLPVYPVIVREYLPVSSAGKRTGLVLGCGAVGMALGSWMGGFVYDHTGHYAAAFALGVAANLANLAIVAALIRRTGPRVMRVTA